MLAKIFLLISELFATKRSLFRIRNFFLKKSGISISKNVFIDQHFAVHNPRNITFGNNVSLGHFCKLWAFHPVVFGDNIQAAIGLMIVSGSHDINNYQPLDSEMKVVIEGENWIGASVLIIGGVTIGRGTVVGAGSVVVKDLPPYTVCVGNPCKPIKKRKPSDLVSHHFGVYKPKIKEEF